MDQAAPTGVTGLSSGVTAVAGGLSHSCAVTAGSLRCWGTNLYGELGDDAARPFSAIPVEVLGFPSLAAPVPGVSQWLLVGLAVGLAVATMLRSKQRSGYIRG